MVLCVERWVVRSPFTLGLNRPPQSRDQGRLNPDYSIVRDSRGTTDGGDIDKLVRVGTRSLIRISRSPYMCALKYAWYFATVLGYRL